MDRVRERWRKKGEKGGKKEKRDKEEWEEIKEGDKKKGNMSSNFTVVKSQIYY